MTLPRRLMPSLQELMAFEAAARHGNFTRAGAELALTQGAISKQIKHLEDTLGVALFERVNRQVVLTRAGRTYAAAAREMIAGIEAVTYSMVASAGSRGALAIASLPTFATRWLIPRLPDFVAGQPGVNVNVATKLQPFDFELEPFDLAIHYGSAAWPGAELTHLFDETLIVVASPAYRDRLTLAGPGDLKRATLLQQATRPALWGEWFDRAGARHDHPFRGPLFDQFSMVAAAAAAGMGAALVPQFLVQDELATRRLVRIGSESLSGSGAYYLAVPLTKRRDPLSLAFRAWILDQSRAAGERS